MNQHATLCGLRCPMPGAMRPFTGAEEGAALAAAEESAALAGSGTAAGSALDASLAASAAGAGGLSLSAFGMSPATLALQGGSLALKALATDDATRRRTAIKDAMTDYQRSLAAKDATLAQAYVEGSTPQARQDSLEAAQAQNKLGYEKTIGAAQAFEGTGDPAGKLSAAYRTAQADSAEAVAQRTKNLIQALSVMRAPGVVQKNTGIRFGRAAGDQSVLTSGISSAGTAGNTDMSGVIANPWMNLGGDALSGVASGIALKNALKGARSAL